MTTTFREIQDDVLRFIALSNDKDAREFVKRAINHTAETIWRFHAWRERRAVAYVNTVAPYETGTVTVTSGSITLTGSGTTFTSGMVGRKFALSYSEPYYTIESYTSATEVTLDRAYVGDTAAAQSYVIYDDVVSLTSMDSLIANEVICMYQGKDRPMDDLTSQAWSNQGLMPRSANAPSSFRMIENDTSGNHQIQLWPSPDKAYAIRYNYLSTYTDMKSDGDTCVVPEARRELIICGASAQAFRYNEEFNKAIAEDRRFAQGLRDAVSEERALHPQSVILRPFDRRSGSYAYLGRIAIDWSNVV